MPSVIGTDLTSGVNVAANYRRIFAPFTRFSTREIAIFQISLFGLSSYTLTDEELDDQVNPYYYPDSPVEYEVNGWFARAVIALQQNVEVLAVFRPGDARNENDGNSFIVMVSADTANTGNENLDAEAGYNNKAKSIAYAISNALEVYTEVAHMRVRGGEFRYSDLNGLATPDSEQAVKVSAGTKPE